MVGNISPHAYSRELVARGGTAALLREIRKVDRDCSGSDVTPIYTLTHLCALSRVSYNDVRDAIFDYRSHYRTRKIVKKSGHGTRTLHEPSAPLKSLQHTILNNCLPLQAASDISYAFEKNRNTGSAARVHVGARSVIHVDVEDFYGSISSKRVYKLFRSLGYPELLSLELSLVTSVGHVVTLIGPGESGLTYEVLNEGRLPQGASTSGKISNLVCRGLDEQLLMIGHKWGGVVTRYADDITFSTPHVLSKRDCTTVFHELSGVLSAQRLTLNTRKTRILPSTTEFRMLGLCVGQTGIWLTRNYKDSIRAHLYGVEKFGLAAHSISRGFDSDFSFMNFMWGHYAYSKGIDSAFAEHIRSRLSLVGVPLV